MTIHNDHIKRGDTPMPLIEESCKPVCKRCGHEIGILSTGLQYCKTCGWCEALQDYIRTSVSSTVQVHVKDDDSYTHPQEYLHLRHTTAYKDH